MLIRAISGWKTFGGSWWILLFSEASDRRLSSPLNASGGSWWSWLLLNESNCKLSSPLKAFSWIVSTPHSNISPRWLSCHSIHPHAAHQMKYSKLHHRGQHHHWSIICRWSRNCVAWTDRSALNLQRMWLETKQKAIAERRKFPSFSLLHVRNLKGNWSVSNKSPRFYSWKLFLSSTHQWYVISTLSRK